MQTKTLLILLFFAVQCIERSFETVSEIFYCKHDVECLETVYKQNLNVGLVPILITEDNAESAPKVSKIMDFFKGKPRDFRVLQVIVSRGRNKALASYLYFEANTPTGIKYPFVAMMKNHWLLNCRSIGYVEESLYEMLEEADRDDPQNYTNFSVGVLNAIMNFPGIFQPIEQYLSDAITALETGGNASTGSPTQQRNVSQSTQLVATGPSKLPKKRGRKPRKPFASSTSASSHHMSGNTSIRQEEFPIRSRSDGSNIYDPYIDLVSNPLAANPVPAPNPIPAPNPTRHIPKRKNSAVTEDIFETDNTKKNKRF